MTGAWTPLSVREGNWRRKLRWRTGGWRHRLALRIAPWLRPPLATGGIVSLPTNPHSIKWDGHETVITPEGRLESRRPCHCTRCGAHGDDAFSLSFEECPG